MGILFTFQTGPRLIDGSDLNSILNGTYSVTNLTYSTQNGLTASTTHTSAGGVPLVAQINRFTTVASAGDAATLPVGNPGDDLYVINDGTNAMQIYGNPNDVAGTTIDGTAGATGVALTNAKRAVFICMAAGVWVSFATTKST